MHEIAMGPWNKAVISKPVLQGTGPAKSVINVSAGEIILWHLEKNMFILWDTHMFLRTYSVFLD